MVTVPTKYLENILKKLYKRVFKRNHLFIKSHFRLKKTFCKSFRLKICTNIIMKYESHTIDMQKLDICILANNLCESMYDSILFYATLHS